MEKELEISGKKLTYTLKTSKRSKYMRLAIYPAGECVVTIPLRFDVTMVDKFLISRSQWIFKKLEFFAQRPVIPKLIFSKQDYGTYKQQALVLVNERLHYFNQFYNLAWKKVTIRNQKTRWGSCSRQGNLNFSYRLALLEPELADLVIVHELCHLKEFNHSAKFWELVSRTIPNYKILRKQLKLLA